MKRLAIAVAVLLVGVAAFFATRVDYIVSQYRDHHRIPYFFDFDYPAIVRSSNPGAPDVVVSIVGGLGCGERDAQLDKMIDAVVAHPPALTDPLVRALTDATIFHRHPTRYAALLPALDTHPKARATRLQAFKTLRDVCFKPEELAWREEALAELLAALDRGGTNDPDTVAMLVDWQIEADKPPPPVIARRLADLAGDVRLARGWLREFEQRKGDHTFKEGELQRFLAAAGQSLRAHPQALTDAALEHLRHLAYLYPKETLPLAGLFPDAKARLEEGKYQPTAFLSLLDGGGYDEARLHAILKGYAIDAGRAPDSPAQQTWFQTPVELQKGDEATIEVLASMGARAAPLLVGYLHPDTRRRTRIAAEALARTKPMALVEALLPYFDRYEAVRQPDTYFEQRRFSGVLVEGMLALRATSDPSGDLPLLRGMASREPILSHWARKELERRFEKRPEALVDGILQYVSRRESFSREELDSIRKVLVELGPEKAGAAVERSLVKLLDAQQGKPEAVFWASKWIGLSACAKVCGKSALPIVQKYVADTSAYEVRSTSWNSKTGVTKVDNQFSVPFAQIAEATLKELDP